MIEDVQESVFDAGWLRSNCYTVHHALRRAESEAVHVWGREMGPKILSDLAVPYGNVMNDDKALLQLLRILYVSD